MKGNSYFSVLFSMVTQNVCRLSQFLLDGGRHLQFFPMLKTQSANAININVRAVEIPQLVMGHGTEV